MTVTDTNAITEYIDNQILNEPTVTDTGRVLRNTTLPAENKSNSNNHIVCVTPPILPIAQNEPDNSAHTRGDVCWAIAISMMIAWAQLATEKLDDTYANEDRKKLLNDLRIGGSWGDGSENYIIGTLDVLDARHSYNYLSGKPEPVSLAQLAPTVNRHLDRLGIKGKYLNEKNIHVGDNRSFLQAIKKILPDSPVLLTVTNLRVFHNYIIYGYVQATGIFLAVGPSAIPVDPLIGTLDKNGKFHNGRYAISEMYFWETQP